MSFFSEQESNEEKTLRNELRVARAALVEVKSKEAALREENARLRAEIERLNNHLDVANSTMLCDGERSRDLQAKLAQVVALHHDGPGFGDSSGWCAACGDCWPCATVAAAKGE